MEYPALLEQLQGCACTWACKCDCHCRQCWGCWCAWSAELESCTQFLKFGFLKFVFGICLWNSFLKFCFEMWFWKLCFWILFLEYVFDIRHSHFRSRSAFHFVNVILKLEERMEGSQKHRKLAWSTMPPNKKRGIGAVEEGSGLYVHTSGLWGA